MKPITISGFSDEICADFEEQLKTVSRLGLSHIEIRGVDGKNISQLSPGETEDVKYKLKKYGVKISAIGSPIGKIGIHEDFEPHFALFQRVVEIAKELDTPYIRMFSFFIPKGEDPAACRDLVLARLRRMIDYAREKDVVLLHENEKDIYGDTAPRCRDLMEQLNCDHFKAVFDFANFIQVGQDTVEAFQALWPFVAYVHVKDAVGLEVVPAGMGEGHVKEILRALMAGGYGGYLSLEPHLSDFAGFASLQQGEKEAKYFADGSFAWTVALNALKGILYDLKW
jgi:sugar phosphate isomerase/epimerase